MNRVFLLVFTLALAASLAAQYVPVEIDSYAEDLNGRQLVTKFRDVIRYSPSYTIAYSDGEPHFKVRIDTMDRWKGDSLNEGVSTIYNYSIFMNLNGMDIYCYSQLGYVGKDVLDDVAYQIYADLDEYVESFREYLTEYSEDY